ncbi:Signal transduction protein, partial [Coemansia erecta]
MALAKRLPEEQEFFEQLEQELAKVDEFYKQKQNLFGSRLTNIKKQQAIYDEMLREELEVSTIKIRPNMTKSFSSIQTRIGGGGGNSSSSSAGDTSMGKAAKSSMADSGKTGNGLDPSPQLRTARSKIKHAMLELYRGMDLLKNYRILCYTAFIKALKKYQKTAKWCEGTEYFLNRVDSCYMATSNQLNRMSGELESLYVKKYADGSRSKGMNKLR